MGWVNLPVFNHRDVLRSGTHTLYMWPVEDEDTLLEDYVNSIGESRVKSHASILTSHVACRGRRHAARGHLIGT